jgi:hypothetical protein
MSRRKPLTTLAAITAALALSIPVATASAAPTAPAVRTAFIGARLQPGSLPCQILIGQIRFAVLTKNTAWANVVSNVFVYSGCGGAAI